MDLFSGAYNSDSDDSDSNSVRSKNEPQNRSMESGTESPCETSPPIWTRMGSDDEMECETNPDAASEYSCQLRRLSRLIYY